jgi:uncharacterized protein (DUF427 family)
MIDDKRITIHPHAGTWVVRAGGAVLGETTRALELLEKGHDPVIYFPREDIAMAFLEPSETRTECPFKGTASHWNIVGKSGTIPDAGWSYEDPRPEVREIAGRIAFYPEKATVEEV